jgi:hypothetical protein
MALQINCNIHFHFAQKLRHIAIAFQLDVVKVVEGLDEPRPHRAAVIGSEGNRRYLETRPVVAFKQSRHEMGRGMFAKIRRQIGNADFVVPVDLPFPERMRQNRHTLLNIILRALPLQRFVVALASSRNGGITDLHALISASSSCAYRAVRG